MLRSLSRLVLTAALFACVGAGVPAAQVQVTFRFLPDLTSSGPTVTRAFLPGGFNDWGTPYGPDGQIQPGHRSQMTYRDDLAEYRYTVSLPLGQTSYKIQYHINASGSEYQWISDPLVAETIPPNGDSVVRVTDPMLFELARERGDANTVEAVSAGVYGTAPITTVTFTVNEATYTTGIENTGDGVYRLVLPAPVAAGSFFRVDARDAAGRTVTASVGSVPPVVADAPVPAGVPDGITYDPADPTRATLVLRAPTNQYVYVRGSFNDWQTQDAYLLNRDTSDPRGTRWWITLTGLAPGQDALFQYLVDGSIRVTDPYAARVIYPGEPGYPTGQTTFPVGVLRPGATPFAWTDDDFEATKPEDLVIYELFLRGFLADSRLTTLADTLDYITRLGVNTIELMPVSQRDAADSWGYDPGFHFAVDTRYGRPEDLKTFVDAAHARGLTVILDVVYNQATSQSPLVRLDNTGDLGPPTATNPWANVAATHDFSPFNDLNHESPLTQLWLDAANRWWIEEYHVDGYRFDFTSGFMQTGPFYQYNQSRINILTRMIGALREAHPDVLLTMEHLTPLSEVRAVTQYGEDRGWPASLSWVLSSEPYHLVSAGYPTNPASSLARTYTPNLPDGGLPVRSGITYMESHDEQWMMYTNRTTGNTSGDYSVRDFNTALDRQKEAAAFFFTVPGPRLMWQFEELGYGGGPGECLVATGVTCPAGTSGRIQSKPVRWDYSTAGVAPVRGAYTGSAPLTPASDAEREARLRLYKTFAALIGLRSDYAIFRSPATRLSTQLGATPTRALRLTLDDAPAGEPTRALVVGNFGVDPARITISSEAVRWYDFFDDTQTDFAEGTTTLLLQPGEFHVYTDVDVPSPERGLITAGEDAAPASVAPLSLSAAPNPVATRATVRYSLAETGDVRLEAFDVLGRRVAVLADGVHAAGAHEARFDTSTLPVGVYVLRLSAGEQTQTARLTVAR